MITISPLASTRNSVISVEGNVYRGPHHKVGHKLLLLLLCDTQNGQGPGSVVHHHTVHAPTPRHHLPTPPPAAAHVHQAGLQRHLSPAPTATRWGSDQTQPSRLQGGEFVEL